MNFLSKIEKYSSNVCLIDENKKVFYYKDILKISKNTSKNLKRKKLIFVLAQNHIEFITSYIGFFRKGLVQMIIDPKIENKLLRDLIKYYLPYYIFLPISKKINIKDYIFFSGLKKHKILKFKKKVNYPINKDLALLLSTSGSTGSKKFVKLSYKNIYDNTKNIVKYLKINQNHRTITTMPPFYTYGLSIINTHLYMGASIFVNNIRIIEKVFWKLFKEFRITSFGGVPYFYEIIKKLNFHKMNLPSLKYFTQAGGPLNRELTKYFLHYAETNKIIFIVMYGQVEATSRISYLPYKMSKKKLGSIGIPIPGGKIRLENAKSNDDTKGEIVYEGKNVSMGYAKNFGDLEKDDENQGILKTGDLAIKDDNGYLYITGRKSRNVKLFGHRVNLDELEQILFKKGYNCLCSGNDNRVVIFHTNKDYDHQIVKYLSKKTNFRLDCFQLKYIKEFPLNEIGKISYKKLEKFL